ncbi:MAG: enolase C-terminal domain-like protein [Ignavibacteriaceae bacterium]|nr:enolase C-terminal domain-like protein [Ignavibacteriaceae bacterium]
MKSNRRQFIKTSAMAGALGILPAKISQVKWREKVGSSDLEEAAERKVLNKNLFNIPVIIESIELFKFKDYYFVKSRSRDGAEGVSFTNNKASYLYPLLKQQVFPFFISKDARDLESLIEGVYRYESNYKLSGIAFWSCVAWVEFSLLDMLGKIINKPVGAMLGEIIRTEIPIYTASGNRGTTPQEEVDILAKKVAETGAKAVKFKVGGRMSNNEDSLAGRTEELIKLTRKVLGDNIEIQADGNGSYDVPNAIRVGRLLEEIKAFMYEEPCPFDYLEETKKVADALSIPISIGEEETSLRRFRWIIENNAAQIVQPDLHYNGGMIRVTRVARMAAKAGKKITIHISSGFGYVDMLHFASFTPNTGRFQEYKGSVNETGMYFDPPLRLRDGMINVPTGAGFGIKDTSEIFREGVKI